MNGRNSSHTARLAGATSARPTNTPPSPAAMRPRSAGCGASSIHVCLAVKAGVLVAGLLLEEFGGTVQHGLRRRPDTPWTRSSTTVFAPAMYQSWPDR